jgi:predicted ATPase
MACESIEVHLPFQTAAYWGTQSVNARTVGMRDSVTVESTKTLDRFGSNLANAFYSLRNEASASDWEDAMDLVRLGLGQWVESVDTRADAGGGKIALWIKARNRDDRISAAALSDGQLAYLAFVALACLPTPRSVLVIDEIELHLHPAMIGRVMSLMKRIAERTPVVITTHSRHVLNCLDNPAEQIITLELNPDTLTTVQKRYDAETLSLWLQKYDDVGAILDAGNEAVLFQHAITKSVLQPYDPNIAIDTERKRTFDLE